MSKVRVKRDYFTVVKLIRKKVFLVDKHIKSYETSGNTSDKIEVACGINQICDLLVKLQFLQEWYTLDSVLNKNLNWPKLAKAGTVLGYNIKVPEYIVANEGAISSWVTRVDNGWVNNISIDLLKGLLCSIKHWFTQICMGGSDL